MESTNEKLEVKESSTPRVSGKSSKEGSSQGELLCLKVPQGATEQNPGSENIEGLTQKVGTLGLQGHRRNRCGAAKKRARKARLAEAPTGESASGLSRPLQSDRPHTQQKPGTSGALSRKRLT
jgi:hypothetical protein